MKAVILARVSTEEQKDAGNSLPAQIRRIQDYCKRKDFKIAETFSFDESAYKTKRDEFDNVLEYLEKNKEKIAICFDKVDRLSRNIFDKRVSALYEKAIVDEIELHFVSDGQVINSKMSAVEKFQFGMSLGLAKYYSDAISDNVKRAFEQKRRVGEWTGPIPFGYTNIPLNEKKGLRKDIAHDEERSYIVVELFNRYASGNCSCASLAKELKERKITTAKGKPVYTSVVHIILKNPFYYGVAYSRKYDIHFDHKYKPLITKSLFLKVQDQLTRKNCNPTKTLNKKQFIFNGLLKCAKCGCSMTAEIKKSKYIYYSCTNGKKNCQREYVREEVLLKPIKRVLGQIKLSDKQITKIVAYLKKSHDSQTLYHKKKIKQINETYDKLQKRISNSYDLLMDCSITKDIYDKKLKEYTEKQHDLDLQKSELTSANENYYIVAKSALSLAQRSLGIFESSEVTQKNQLLGFLLQNSVVDRKKLVFTMREPFNSIAKVSSHPNLLPLLDVFRTLDWSKIKDDLQFGNTLDLFPKLALQN